MLSFTDIQILYYTFSAQNVETFDTSLRLTIKKLSTLKNRPGFWSIL